MSLNNLLINDNHLRTVEDTRETKFMNVAQDRKLSDYESNY